MVSGPIVPGQGQKISGPWVSGTGDKFRTREMFRIAMVQDLRAIQDQRQACPGFAFHHQ